MGDTLLLDLPGARDLLRAYRWRVDHLADDVGALGRLLGAAAPFLGYPGDGDAGSVALERLRSVEDQLRADHDDLAWRIASVDALGPESASSELAHSVRHLQRLTVAELVDMLGGDNHRRALDELAIRATIDTEASRTIARTLGAGGVRDLRDRLHAEMLEVTSDWNRNRRFEEEGWVFAAASVEAEFDDAFQVYGALLASFSHHRHGLDVLEAVFSLERPDSVTNYLPVALLHGDWHPTFLHDLFERVFTMPSPFWEGFGRLHGAMELVEAELFFPRLLDPHAVLVEAIIRDPDLARRIVMEDDAFRRIVHFDHYGPFGGVDLDLTTEVSRMAGGSRMAEVSARLFELVLVDPSRTEEIFAFLGTGSTIDDRGLEIHVPGLFHQIADLGLPDSAPFRQVMADVWNLQWHNVADLANDVRPTDTIGGAVLAEIFRDETARLEVMAGFGAYLEVLYSQAFAAGEPGAVDQAGVGALRAFQHIDEALDSLQPGATDRSLLRSAFRTGAGFGAKQLIPFLASPPTWKVVAAGFVVSEVIREIGTVALPDDVSRYPSSRSVLHDLFVATPVHDGPPLPTDAEVIFANAALAARPDLAAGIEPRRWLVDGVIRPPAGEDPDELDDFGFWFGRNFTGDSPFLPMITGPTRDIAAWLATEEFLES